MVYNISTVDQCILLDLLLGTNLMGYVLSNLDTAEAAARCQIKSIKAADTAAILENVDNHQSVKLAKKGDLAQNMDRGRFWTGIVQGFYKLLTSLWWKSLLYMQLCHIA